MTSRRVAAAALVAAAMVACASAETARGGSETVPRYRSSAHSHNDYQRQRPLLDAVVRGFASVEADIVLKEGVLYVAHAESEIRPTATLERLYLEPARDLVRRNGGSVYGPSGSSMQLLVDVKSAADETYAALDRTLADYDDILTSWTREGARIGPVTVVLSGNRAISLVLADAHRYVALDGRLEDDRTAFTTELMPLVSVDWESLHTPEALRFTRAREIVALFHEEGRKVRFWATPDREEVWTSLIGIGVDFIGTDDVLRLERVLNAQ